MTSYLSCVKHILIKGVPKRLNFYLGVPREGIVVALASIKKKTHIITMLIANITCYYRWCPSLESLSWRK